MGPTAVFTAYTTDEINNIVISSLNLADVFADGEKSRKNRPQG